MHNNISVVICVKDREKTIGKTLKSVVENNPYEIIIIDGNSKDHTVDIAKKYTNKIYFDNGKGLAFARQLGAEKAMGEYVIYVDSDVELPNKDTILLMLKELKDNNWVAITAQVSDPRKDKRYWEQGEDFHWKTRLNKAGEKKLISTIVCMIRRDIILKYTFNPYFKEAAEDGDFFRRLGKDGYKFGISHEIVYHYHRASFRQFVKQRMGYGKGNAKAILEHKEINLLLAPFEIALFGFWLCINNRKIIFIPFYIVWMIALSLGTLLGLIEIIKNPTRNIPIA